MKKPYEGHEIEYRRMKRRGIRSWGERSWAQSGGRLRELDRDTEGFLKDVLTQTWAPKQGAAIELGCGTGPILRWLHRRGFTGLGVDVSATAISMARSQSQGLGLRYRRGDLCRRLPAKPGTFDLAVDGHCLHCIIEPADRKAFLENVRKLLKPGGLFVVMTMCAPVNREAFARLLPGQRLIRRVIYVPTDHAPRFEGHRVIQGRPHMPTRYLAHWRNLLSEIRNAGFELRLIRYSAATSEEPSGDLCVAALAP